MQQIHFGHKNPHNEPYLLLQEIVQRLGVLTTLVPNLNNRLEVAHLNIEAQGIIEKNGNSEDNHILQELYHTYNKEIKYAMTIEHESESSLLHSYTEGIKQTVRSCVKASCYYFPYGA